MTTPQAPLGSGFGPRSTPRDVLDGVDLGGKTALVTGGYSGLGLETTRALLGAGADVIVPARRPEHATEVLSEVDQSNGSVTVVELDLADLASVERCAADLLDGGTNLDIMINNAAIMACPETRVGPGWEAQFATNHLGHFALANRLWPLLRSGDGARVVALSSTGHKRSAMRWDDPHWTTGYDKWDAYCRAPAGRGQFGGSAPASRDQACASCKGPLVRVPGGRCC